MTLALGLLLGVTGCGSTSTPPTLGAGVSLSQEATRLEKVRSDLVAALTASFPRTPWVRSPGSELHDRAFCPRQIDPQDRGQQAFPPDSTATQGYPPRAWPKVGQVARRVLVQHGFDDVGVVADLPGKAYAIEARDGTGAEIDLTLIATDGATLMLSTGCRATGTLRAT